MKSAIQKCTTLDLFLLLSLTVSGAFVVVNIATDGAMFNACVMNNTFQFSDYYYHIAGASIRETMYAELPTCCFPPLAYCMYWVLWKMSPYNDYAKQPDWRYFRDFQNSRTFFLLYNVLVIVLLLYVLGQYFKKKEAKYTVLLPIALIVSFPVLCTSLERGNAVLPVAMLVCLALLWMEDKSKKKREGALILIGIAAAFKFYPAILGMKYVKEKDWKRVFRLVVYGLILVFVPFIFFGGLDGMYALIGTLTDLTIEGGEAGVRFGTVRGIMQWIFRDGLGFSNATALLVGRGCEPLFLVLCMVGFFCSEKKWQEALFLSGVMASFIPSSYMYTSVYYMAPMLLFFRDREGVFLFVGNGKKERAWDMFHTICFSMIFSVPFFWNYLNFVLDDFGIYFGVFLMTYLLLGVNLVSVLRRRLRREREEIMAIEAEEEQV